MENNKSNMNESQKKYSDLEVEAKVLQIADWLADKKAKDPVIIDLRGKESYAECIVIVSATSSRHAQGLAEHVRFLAKQEKFEFLHDEGFQTGQWILLDLNDVLVNVFQGGARELYNLEGLWADAPRIELKNISE